MGRLMGDLPLPEAAACGAAIDAWAWQLRNGGDQQAEVEGHSISASQCRALLAEADALGLSRPDAGTLEFALHDTAGDLVAVGARRAVERGARGPGLRRPPDTPHYRPRAGQRRFPAGPGPPGPPPP